MSTATAAVPAHTVQELEYFAAEDRLLAVLMEKEAAAIVWDENRESNEANARLDRALDEVKKQKQLVYTAKLAAIAEYSGRLSVMRRDWQEAKAGQ